MVRLEVEGSASDVGDVVDAVLDNGEFQDAINEYAEGLGLEVKVVSAVLSEVGG